jgi:hypothetical protein
MQSAMNTVNDMVPSMGTGLAAASEDRDEGAEKSGGFHQEFVKGLCFRKGITFYTFLIKRAGFARGLFPTICVCG